ncbi:MAG: ABC transporter ATP-binding protein [Limnochordales bacterium]|jgi:ABC-type branched-chain amino acid transport systems, ATPase component|nr:MAG: ABC transporter ATP-binding protein [Bacillota bacterium]
MLVIDGIVTHYGPVEALKGISLEVQPGEIVTLIGANGAGKTTTLRTLSGLVRPTRGSIQYEGRELTTAPPERIVEMGIAHVPEGRRVFPMMSVVENLELGAFTRKDKAGIREDMERVFELFPRLAERRNQLAGTMSGGEQQMLAIGRALMTRPKLLLLDEPSMGLAPLIVENIFEIIQEINAQGTTVLLVEQNAHMALSIAHKGYVMETGRIVLSDTSAALMKNEDVRRAYLGG